MILRLRVFISTLNQTNIFIPELAIWLTALYLFDQDVFSSFERHRNSDMVLVKSITDADAKLRPLIEKERVNMRAANALINPSLTTFFNQPLTAYLDKLLRSDRDGAFEKPLQREANTYLSIQTLI